MKENNGYSAIYRDSLEYFTNFDIIIIDCAGMSVGSNQSVCAGKNVRLEQKGI